MYLASNLDIKLMNNKIVVGISQGDINSISSEVIIKALSDSRLLDSCIPVIYGSSKVIGIYKKHSPDTENFSANVINSPREAHSKRVNIINCIPDTIQSDPGKQSEDGARAAMMALEEAVKDLKMKNIDVLVTGPFNKFEVSKGGFNFTGHTEYLGNVFGIKDTLMFMVSDRIKVGLVTNHMPLSEVPSHITTKLIVEKLRIMSNSLKRDFAVRSPKIAVMGLNPHCGDQGLIGNEETEIIKPAVRQASDEGILAFGPYSPDGFFGSEMMGKFDAVLAMYHDQGLIPFKALAFENGVNFTAGLPVVRTSPDHGTAFEIAGKNRANATSMLSAIYYACDIYRNRQDFDDLRSNILVSEHTTPERQQ